jgi:putative transposase
MQEFLQQNSEKISNANSSICENIILTNKINDELKRSRTSDQVSTSRDPACYEYWDPSCKGMYHTLSWLHETAWQDLDWSSFTGCVDDPKHKSWFSMTHLQSQKKSLARTSWPLFKCTVVDGTERAATETEPEPEQMVTRSYKLKLRPSQEQKRTLSRWAGCARVTYNKALHSLLKYHDNSKHKYALRNRFVTVKSRSGKLNNFFANKGWLKQSPKSIRQSAVEEAVAARKAALTNKQRGNIQKFDLRFKTKKNELQRGWSLKCDKANVKFVHEDVVGSDGRRKQNIKLVMFNTMFGEVRYYSQKQAKKFFGGLTQPPSDPRIRKDQYGEYYLIFSIKKPVAPTRAVKEVVSVDPGIRRFATLYSPTSDSASIVGKNYTKVITPLLLQLDGLISARTHMRKTNVVDQQIRRLRKRIINLRLEMRNKFANWMAKTYDVVVMGKLDTANLAMKRQLKTKTVRQMQSMGHGYFREHLRHKCTELGSTFLLMEEYYTSKTCVSCGQLNDVGSRRVYTCDKCSFRHDRDLVGSCGILLRALRQGPA